MKTRLWPIYIVLLAFLAGCTYNTYVPLEDETTKPRKVNVINQSDQVVWAALEINNIESSPKDFLEVAPGYSYQLPAPAKSKVTLVIRYFDERSLQVKKFDTIFTRQTLESDEQQVIIKNATLYGYVSEDCVIENVTNQVIRISSDQGHRLILKPGEYVIIEDIPSGVRITFWWEAIRYPRQIPMQCAFVPNPNIPQFYRGKWYGSKVSITKY